MRPLAAFRLPAGESELKDSTAALAKRLPGERKAGRPPESRPAGVAPAEVGNPTSRSPLLLFGRGFSGHSFGQRLPDTPAPHSALAPDHRQAEPLVRGWPGGGELGPPGAKRWLKSRPNPAPWAPGLLMGKQQAGGRPPDGRAGSSSHPAVPQPGRPGSSSSLSLALVLSGPSQNSSAKRQRPDGWIWTAGSGPPSTQNP